MYEANRDVALFLGLALMWAPLGYAANQTYTSPGDAKPLKLPATVSTISVSVFGAGGGGGAGGASFNAVLKGRGAGGGGGGSGATLVCNVSVTPGSTVLITVGEPGKGGKVTSGTGDKGGTGGVSSIHIQEPGGSVSALTLSASGGEGGTGGSASNGFTNTPGVGGSAGKSQAAPDCGLGVGGTGLAGGANGSEMPGQGAAPDPVEAARLAAVIRTRKAEPARADRIMRLDRIETPGAVSPTEYLNVSQQIAREAQADSDALDAANAADISRAALCAKAGAGGSGGKGASVNSSSGGINAHFDGSPGNPGCVSIDY